MDLGNMQGDALAFTAMIFVAVFLLAQGLIVPVFGESRRMRKRIKSRLRHLEAESAADSGVSILREKYLKRLSPLERTLETLPHMEELANLIEQAGHKMRAYQLVLISVLTAIGAALVGWLVTRSLLVAAPLGLVAGAFPYFKVLFDRTKRMNLFEEQFPEALDVVKRALRAGHPFSESLHLVAEEMPDPIASEFATTFADLNYGNDVRRALLGLLDRIPSVTVMALVTSVLVQKETGGNLAEILERISSVVRGRFKLQRRVKTLSAEGRMSAWILALVPFGLFAAISYTTPSYLPSLVDDPLGRKLIGGGFVMMVIGIVWIRRIIRIEV